MKLRNDERMARRAGYAALFGTAVEWYDFYIFGTAAALVFGELFFPGVSPAMGVLASFATFWVGFLTRPLGGILFGHFGDRLGRKNTLIVTLMMMGCATFLIGLLPTYSAIGAAAPALLVFLRAVQGLAVGGEWGGAVLIVTEHTGNERRRILMGAFAQQGSPIGHILAALAFSAVTYFSDSALSSWGWRIPFLLSAVLVVIGLIIRLKIEESPEINSVRESGEMARYPLVDVLRKSGKIVLIAMLTIAAVMTSAYFKSTFILSWATTDLGFERGTILNIVLLGAIAQFFVQPFGALLATRYDPRRVVSMLLAVELLTLPLMFALIATERFGLALVGVILAIIPNVMFYATTAGLLAQAFPARVRYTGISVSYALASTVFGGTTPIVGQFLLAATGSIVSVVAFGVLMILVSLFASRALIQLTQAPRDPMLKADAYSGTETEQPDTQR